MSFVLSFDIIIPTVLCEGESEECLPDPKIFLYILASAADAAAVNPNGIKTLLTYGLITFFINDKSVFSNGLRSLPKNLPD